MLKKKKKDKSQTVSKDLYRRVLADLENYKRRVEKERAGWYIDAQIAVIRPILTVVEDIDRAVGLKKETRPVETCPVETRPVETGLGLIQKNFYKILKDLGVSEIDCSKEFSPDLHEALLEVESDKHESGEIVDVVSKGYSFKRGESEPVVIKHAKVSVAK